jgi:PAS domain S-box-containing protein
MPETNVIPQVSGEPGFETLAAQKMQDHFIRLASLAFDIPFAFIWMEGERGPQLVGGSGPLAPDETQALCSLVELFKARSPVCILDTLSHDGLASHPAVSGKPAVRSFAQAVCRADGHPAVGVCLFDTHPGRKLDEKELRLLQEMAEMACDGLAQGSVQFSLAQKSARQAEEELRASQQRLQLVLDNIPQAVFWKDRSSRFLGCNRVFAVHAGVQSPDELAGKTDFDMHWPAQESANFYADDRWVMDNNLPKYHIIERMTQADGRNAWLETNKMPLHDADGNVVGVLGTYEDITERKQAAEALQSAHDELEIRVRERTNELIAANSLLKQEVLDRQSAEAALLISKERYEMAVNAGKVGVWDWNIQLRQLYMDPSLQKMLGIEDIRYKDPFQEWIKVIHPQDREGVKAAMNAYFNGSFPLYEQEYRVILPNYSVRWVLARGSTLHDPQYSPIRKSGTLTDITALKHAEEGLRRRDSVLEALTFASQHLISPAGVENRLGDVLAQLGAAIGFDRAYILQNTGAAEDDLVARRYANWNIPKAAVALPDAFPYAHEGISRWAKTLRSGTAIYGLKSDYYGDERAFIERMHVEAFAWVPIFSEWQWWGVLGFDTQTAGRANIPAEIEALKSAASTLGSALAQQRIRNEELEQRNLAQALSDTAALLNRTLNLDEVLERIPVEINKVVPHDTATIFLVEKNKTQQVRHYGPQEMTQLPDNASAGSVDELPSLQRMIASQMPIIISDTQTSPLWVKRMHLAWVRSFLGAPIQSEGQVIGFITLNSATPGFFTPVHAERLQAFANQAAVAIQNARLYQQAQALATLEERQRLARDLHDAVSQTLWTASIIAEVLPGLWDKDREDGQRSLEHLRRLTQGALAEMRTLLLELRPAALMETKLNDLLLQLAQATMSRKKLTITLDLDSDCALPAEVQVSIYRIAQEALNNIAKHSRASQVRMTLRSKPGCVNLHIQDNGLGFDQELISNERLGLEIMRERALAIHAYLDITSKIGQGTEITVEWPEPSQAGQEDIQ